MSEPTEETQAGDPAEVVGSPGSVEAEAGDEETGTVETGAAEAEAPGSEAPEPQGDGPEADAPSVEELQEKLDATRERLLRSLADFENLRKRTDRELADSRRFAAAEPITEFLVVVDNLELASSSRGSLEDLQSGVEMIVSQTKKLLTRFGVEEVASEGEPFDPAVHDAIARFEDASVSTQIVAEELQKGYVMNGRLLRPAMVKVAVPVEAPGSEGEEGE